MNRSFLPVLLSLLLLSLFSLVAYAGAETPYTGAARVFPEKTPAGESPSPPAVRLIGDTIEEPFVIPSIPFTAQGTTCGFAHDYDEMCPYGGYTAPDVVYAFTPTEAMNVNIDLCGSSYDTKLYVYTDGFMMGNPYACNDDACGPDGYRSRIEGLDLHAGQTYYVVIDAYGPDCGEYDLRVEESWICPIPCPPGGTPEGEPVCHDDYVDQFNSGCGGFPPVFWTLDPSPDPIVICGESGTFSYSGGPYRDTDWYEIDTAHPCSLTVQVDAEFSVSVLLIRANPDCYNYTVLESSTPEFCLPAYFERAIAPGRYWIWAGPGVYFLRLETEEGAKTAKVVLVE